MRIVLSILFGWTLTVATAWALGAILIRKLSLVFYRTEEWLFSFLIGSACLSAIVFALASVKLARKGVFLALGVLAIGYAVYLKYKVYKLYKMYKVGRTPSSARDPLVAPSNPNRDSQQDAPTAAMFSPLPRIWTEP